jgi:ABC-2 type transport system ATP-binding protein
LSSGVLAAGEAFSGPVLETENLRKAFGRIQAVAGISIAVGAGEIVGLLGPNGSGKSTTMKMIIGVLKPDSGKVEVLGQSVDADPIRTKRLVGYVPETPQLYEFLTGVEYLDFVAEMFELPPEVRKERIEQFLGALQLEGHENEMISGYSQGMRQKIAITGALIHHPRLLVLDEPLNGLDPRSAKIVKVLVRSLAREGVGVIFSTHVLEIAEAICDRVEIMYNGTILAEGTVSDLRQKAGMPGSTLEEVFLKITGTDDLSELVKELSR